MAQSMPLADLIGMLPELSGEDTIYAKEPWGKDSEAIAAVEPEEGGLPVAAAKAGLTYFLEVFIAREVVEDMTATCSTPPSTSAIVERIIHYATYDA
jgi:hypothetical protein